MRGLCIAQRPHGIAGTAELERAGALEVFALECELRLREGVDTARAQHRRAICVGRQAQRCGANRRNVDCDSGFSGYGCCIERGHALILKESRNTQIQKRREAFRVRKKNPAKAGLT